MKVIETERITQIVYDLCRKANTQLPQDVLDGLKNAFDQEESERAKEILGILLENADIADKERQAICQDTGQVVVFIELGQDVHIQGGFADDAIHQGVRLAYRDGYFRYSVVQDPLERINTKDNTPAVIHWMLVPGDSMHITVMPKGFGSENMSGLVMLKPADGKEGVLRYVVDLVKKAGGNPCPPIIIGVGMGGTMEKAAILSKKALLRKIGQRSTIPHVAELECRLLQEVNRTGVGAQGLGGTITALDVFIETYPTHIAGLPVAVNLSCHADRHADEII
jgi:fumarate hydratase subunit alpha